MLRFGIILLSAAVAACASGGNVIARNVVTKDPAGRVEATVVQMSRDGSLIRVVLTIQNTTSQPLALHLSGAVILKVGQTASQFFDNPSLEGRTQFPVDYAWSDSPFAGLIGFSQWLTGKSAHWVEMAPSQSATRVLFYKLPPSFEPGSIYVRDTLYLDGNVRQKASFPVNIR